MRAAPTPGGYVGSHSENAGDPLDGLVNLFDLSLVLAVGFLLAALSALNATDLLTTGQVGGGTGKTDQAKVLPGSPPLAGSTIQGQGEQVGSVYKLQDGRYVFVPAPGASAATGSTGATGSTPGSTGATGSAPSTSGTTGTSGSPPASTTTKPAAPVTTDGL